jgi:hypothetical protein
MSRIDPKFMLRFSPELKELVQAAAAANKRSMNAEIVDRLEVSFKLEESVKDRVQDTVELRRSIDARLDEMEHGSREQRAIFEQMMETAKKVLGEEFVTKAQATPTKRP